VYYNFDAINASLLLIIIICSDILRFALRNIMYRNCIALLFNLFELTYIYNCIFTEDIEFLINGLFEDNIIKLCVRSHVLYTCFESIEFESIFMYAKDI